MTLTFVTNLVHHHQLPVADEFYKILGDSYHYIATDPMPDWLINGGYDPNLERPYIVRTYQSDEAMTKAMHLIDESDVVIMGHSPKGWAYKRKKAGKVTFYAMERPYREEMSRYKLFKATIANYKNYGRFPNTYMLCASAFTAKDFASTHCLKARCFKWGYMTAVDADDLGLDMKQRFEDSGIATIMWCARFLKLKHPELPVQLAARLKAKGYRFIIDMYGGGEELENTKELIKNLNVVDVINLCGNKPNAEILQDMRKHSLFLFTSDRREGWGAVLNESMSSGCVPVASDEIGSSPYLIKDGINGLVFKSCDIDSLERAVTSLLNNPNRIIELSRNALYTMQNIWSPKAAANNFIELAEHALNGTLNKYKRAEGPASWDKSNI